MWGVVGGNPPSSFSSVVWGLVGGRGFPPSPLWFGVWWVGIPPPSPSGVGFGGVEFVLGSLGGLVVVVKLLWCAKPYSVGRFCSETLGCPFKCFGKPWRFLLGICIIYYRLYSV